MLTFNKKNLELKKLFILIIVLSKLNLVSQNNKADAYFASGCFWCVESIYENLKDSYIDKYEYNLPEILLDKNLFQSEKYGTLDLQSNLKINNYDTNKTSKTLINDLDWESKNFNLKTGFNNKFLGKFKTCSEYNSSPLQLA